MTKTLLEFQQCKLESKSVDPDEWFVKLDEINERLDAIGTNYRKKDYKLKAHLLSSLPEGYEDVKTKISRKEDTFTVEEIEEEIKDKWDRDFAQDSKTKGKNLALNVKNKGKGKKFKSKC